MRVTVTREELDRIQDVIIDGWPGDDSVRVYPDYSGRGMFGRTCVGLVYSDPTTVAVFLHLLAAVLDYDLLVLVDELGGAGSDSMGLDRITYWSNLVVEPQDG